MAIAFAGQAAYYSGTTNSETHNIGLPNISVGDLWIMHFTIVGSGCTSCTDGIPNLEAGWQSLTPASSSGGFLGGSFVFYKIRDGGDNTTHTVTFNSGFGKQVVCNTVGYSGTATNVPFDDDSHRDPWDEGTSTSPLCGALTTTTDNTMILRLMNADDGDGNTLPISFPGGVSNRGSQDISDAGAGNGGHTRFGEDGIQGSAGGTGTATWSIGASEGWNCQTIAIRDAAFDIDVEVKDFNFDVALSKIFTKDLTFDSAFFTTVDNNLTLNYDIVELVDNNLTILYDMTGVVSNSIILDYDIFNLVDNNLTLLYDMIGVANNSITLNYDINEFVDNNVTFDYDINVFVNNNATLNYDIFNLVDNSITNRWDILNFISNSLTVRWDILNFISNTLTNIWDIRSFVDNSLTVIQSTLVFVSNKITSIYQILNPFTTVPTLNKSRKVRTLKRGDTTKIVDSSGKTINT